MPQQSQEGLEGWLITAKKEPIVLRGPSYSVKISLENLKLATRALF